MLSSVTIGGTDEARGSTTAVRSLRSSSPQHNANSREHELKFGVRELPDLFCQDGPIKRDNPRYVCYGVFRQSGQARLEHDVARRFGPPKIAGQRDADDCRDPALIKGV